jgi:hypothetical protein
MTTVIEDITWSDVFVRFPDQWVALSINELADNGIKSGTLVAIGKSEAKVTAKLRQFESENPGRISSLLYTGPFDRDVDFISPGLWLQ